ncbi:UNVERIFIED_CONTAM: DNA repair protein rad51c, partial [Siphonaria sp. JEL0065]
MLPSHPIPRPLATFALDSATRSQLNSLGARNSLDVLALAEAGNGGFAALDRCIDFPSETARTLLPQAGPAGFSSISAFDSLQTQIKRANLPSGSSQIDGLFKGGFPTGQVTELCGPPGVGKTQFGMQMCVNVQLVKGENGQEGEAVYIDTEGSFSVERVAEIATASIQRRVPGYTPEEQESQLNALLTKIHVFRVHDHIEQIALLNQMEGVVQQNPRIKLIILDSIAFHFRQGFGDMGLRSRLLSSSAQILRKLAGTYSICVLVVNQMTTKVVKVGTQEHSTLVPAL